MSFYREVTTKDEMRAKTKARSELGRISRDEPPKSACTAAYREHVPAAPAPSTQTAMAPTSTLRALGDAASNNRPPRRRQARRRTPRRKNGGDATLSPAKDAFSSKAGPEGGTRQGPLSSPHGPNADQPPRQAATAPADLRERP